MRMMTRRRWAAGLLAAASSGAELALGTRRA
jgi:hypothetical protein